MATKEEQVSAKQQLRQICEGYDELKGRCEAIRTRQAHLREKAELLGEHAKRGAMVGPEGGGGGGGGGGAGGGAAVVESKSNDQYLTDTEMVQHQVSSLT